MGPYGVAGPHVQMKQHRAYGDDYINPYSQIQANSRPLHGRQGHQRNHRKNRQPGHPSMLAPKADTQRIQKNSPQRVLPGSNSSNQYFLANLDYSFAARNAFEPFETLRPGSQPAGIEDYGAAGPNTKATQNLGYVNNGYGPVSLPQTPSRPGAGVDHSSPPPHLTPTNNHPSSSSQHTPQVGSETSRGPDPTPSKFNGSAYGVNSQPSGIYHDPTHGPGTTQSDIDIQERIVLRDEANAILLPQEDDDGRCISEGQPKDQSDDIDAASSHESLNVLRGSNGSIEKVEGHAAASTAPYEVDEGLFERYLENEGQNQTLTGGIEVPATLNTDSGVSQAEIEEWPNRWLKENDTKPQPSTGGVDGNNAGRSTANAPPPQGAHVQPSSRKVATEEPSADEFQTKYFDTTKPSTWTAEEWKFFGEPFSGPENLTDRHLEILETMRILQLPFDVSKFPHEDYLWFL